MDDNLTAISSSNGIGEGESSNTQPLTSCRDLFSKVFPSYLAMGMSYDDFYNKDHELVIAYRKAFKMKRRQDNEDMWRQGLYTYIAISRIAPLLVPFAKNPKAEAYLDKPIPMFIEDEDKEETAVIEDKGLAYMKAKMIEINKRFGEG